MNVDGVARAFARTVARVPLGSLVGLFVGLLLGVALIAVAVRGEQSPRRATITPAPVVTTATPTSPTSP